MDQRLAEIFLMERATATTQEGPGFDRRSPAAHVHAHTGVPVADLALGGQLQFTVGGDLDLTGVYLSAALAGESTGYETTEFEIASTMAGLRGRFNPWGGEGFGGLTLGTEVGLDIGRFRIDRETGPDEFEYGPGFVLQSTLGAEFYIPSNPFVYHFAPEVGYRLVRPLNSEAENIHEFIFGFGGMF